MIFRELFNFVIGKDEVVLTRKVILDQTALIGKLGEILGKVVDSLTLLSMKIDNRPTFKVIIYPNDKPVVIRTVQVPRVGEKINYKGIVFTVSDVCWFANYEYIEVKLSSFQHQM